MRDQASKSAALLQRLTEEDETLLEHRDPRVEAMLVERLYQNSWPTRYVPLPMLFGAFVLFRNYIDWSHIIGLTALYAGGTWYLDRLRSDFDNTAAILGTGKDWGTRFAIGSGITGLAWGLIGWFCYPPGNFALQAVLCIAWGGLAMSSVSTRAVHLPSFYAFIVAMSVPLFARALLFGEASTVIMACLGGVLLVALCLGAHVANKRERLALALRFRNAELIDQLDRARGDAEAERARAAADLAAVATDFSFTQALTETGAWRWEADPDHMVWSTGMTDLLGIKQGAVMPSIAAWLQLVHADDRVALRDHLARLRNDATADHVAFRVAESGRRLESAGLSERDGEGKVVRVRGIVKPRGA